MTYSINKITFSQFCFPDMQATLAKGVRREKKALVNPDQYLDCL